MSLAVRESLVSSPHTFFSNDCEHEDLRDPAKTQTGLIALLVDLVLEQEFIVEFTAIRCDHHDDSALGLHSHANGYCADLWPLASAKAGDYLDANDERFATFIRACVASAYLYGIGLAGSALTNTNLAASQGRAFADQGGDHIHLAAVEI